MSQKGIQDNIADSLPDLPASQTTGSHDGSGLRIGIVISRFNEALTGGLATSATACLQELGVAPKDILVHWVPGAFELPVALNWMLETESPDAIIAAGAVLQGATIHARTISENVSRSITDLAVRSMVPIIDSVVVADTLEQAEERCLSGNTSRGWYAARAAVEMATLANTVWDAANPPPTGETTQGAAGA